MLDLTDDNINTLNDALSEQEDRVTASLIQATGLLDALKDKTVFSVSKPRLDVSVPNIEPPPFNGDPNSYYGWKTRFTTIVTHNTDIPDAQKQEMLLVAIKDSHEVMQLVENLFVGKALVDGSQFYNALDLIDERFGLSREHVSRMVLQLVGKEKLQTPNHKKLRKYYNYLRTIMSIFDDNGLDLEGSAVILMPLFERILPDQTAERWSAKKTAIIYGTPGVSPKMLLYIWKN